VNPSVPVNTLPQLVEAAKKMSTLEEDQNLQNEYIQIKKELYDL
jgi:hypothetical protein